MSLWELVSRGDADQFDDEGGFGAADTIRRHQVDIWPILGFSQIDIAVEF